MSGVRKFRPLAFFRRILGGWTVPGRFPPSGILPVASGRLVHFWQRPHCRFRVMAWYELSARRVHSDFLDGSTGCYCSKDDVTGRMYDTDGSSPISITAQQ